MQNSSQETKLFQDNIYVLGGKIMVKSEVIFHRGHFSKIKENPKTCMDSVECKTIGKYGGEMHY